MASLPPKTTAPSSNPADSAGQNAAVLSVEHLTAGFIRRNQFVAAVHDVSLSIAPGETLGLVGESGSGKSVTALSIVRLLQSPGTIRAGVIRFLGTDVLRLTEAEMRSVRGAGIGFIFQEPMSALNPVLTVGDHIAEALVVHGRAGWREARRRAMDLLDAVRIADPARLARSYPHQLSGGMRQRVMIAVALACQPQLLIADEPTTALDVTIQAEILDLLRELRQKYQLAVLLITHDLGVIAEMADRVSVMYAGRIVEEAPVTHLFRSPKHPYTRGLLASIPGGGTGTRLNAIEGTVPAIGLLPCGCPFEPRCPERRPECAEQPPDVRQITEHHTVSCHLYPKSSAR
jgi:oligopeptide/dipeptide ABC transporter ATP-binding protein